MKLELKHIAGYLPFGLKCTDTSQENYLFDLSEWIFRPHQHVQPYFKNHLDQILKDDSLKIVLRPLSDLTKEIEHNGERFVPMNIIFICDHFDELAGYNSEKYTNEFIEHSKRLELCYPLILWEKLYEWNFDIHGLIEKGLAIDINTL